MITILTDTLQFKYQIKPFFTKILALVVKNKTIQIIYNSLFLIKKFIILVKLKLIIHAALANIC